MANVLFTCVKIRRFANDHTTTTAQRQQFNMKIKEIKVPDGIIVYNAGYISQPSSDLFDVEAQSRAGDRNFLGRSSAVSFNIDGLGVVVLKHYQRGGLVGKLIQDTYFYNGLHRTRMVAEFSLLKSMLEKQLPVPAPVAAKVTRRGLFYTGELITAKLPLTQTLAQRLQTSGLDEALWSAVGQTVSRFHEKGVYHADLNANNIMLDEKGQVFLVDFDKSHIKKNKSGNWRMANLHRLRRSLNKLKLNLGQFHFDERNWSALLKGYD